MAFDLGAITAKLTADTSEFKKGLKSGENAAKKFGSTTAQKVSAVATSFIAITQAAKILKDSLLALVNVGMEWVDAAALQETLNVKIAQSLANVGEFSQEAVNGISAMSNALQELTGIDNEKIEEISITLLNMNVPVDQLEDGVTAAINLSEALGIELNQAAEQIGRTMGGTTGRLSQMIPELKGLTKEQLKNGAAIDLVNKKYAGFSEALQNTTGVALKRISANFADLKKAIGESITQAPVFTAAMQTINNMLKDGIEWINENKEAFINWTKNFVVNVTAALATAIRLIGKVVSGFRLFTGTIREIRLTGLANELEDVNKQINTFVFGIVNTAEKLEKLKAKQRELQTEYDRLNVIQEKAAQALFEWQQKVETAEEAVINFNTTVANLANKIAVSNTSIQNNTKIIEDNTEAAKKRREEAERQAQLHAEILQFLQEEADKRAVLRAEIALASLAYLDISEKMVLYEAGLIQMVDTTEEQIARLANAIESNVTTSKGFWARWLQDIGTVKQNSEKAFKALSTGTIDLWTGFWRNIGAETENGGEKLIQATAALFGQVAAEFGKFLIIHGAAVLALALFPPDPSKIIAGAAQIAGGLALTALGGLASGFASKPTGGGGGGGGTSATAPGAGLTTETTEDIEERNQNRILQININGNLIGQEDYVRNELVPEINRQVKDADTVLISTDVADFGSQSQVRT